MMTRRYIMSQLAGCRCHNLKCNADGTWTWEMDGMSCYTDHYGDGLWVEFTQIEGACQFSLAGMSVSGARKKINRYFA